MFRLKSRKGISEIISVTLLIVIVVILASLFFAWSRNSAKTKMDQVTAELKAASDLECYNAQFYVDSCTIYSTTKTTRIVLINNSNIRLFNLQLTINGEVSGSFDEIVEAGETVYLSTDTNFNFTRGDQSTLNSMDIDSIDNITLTNGACPKEVIDVSGCRIVNAFWPPTASVGSGTYYLEQSVTLSAGSGATIYYTLDGSTPTTDSNVYSTPITIPEDANTTLKAIASAESSLASDVNTWVYNITHTLDAPIADPEAGDFTEAIDVNLYGEDGATIYYTTNGEDPTTESAVYSSPINVPLDTFMTIKAIAARTNYGTSTIFSGDYNVVEEYVPQQYDTGALSPGTMADDASIGTVAWSNPDNSKTSDNSYSSAIMGGQLPGSFYGDTTHYLKATNFGFNIPTGATIDGIKVELEKYTFGPYANWELKIVKSDGSIGTTNMANTDWNITADPNTYQTESSDTNLWGESWTAEDINDPDFGIVISITGVSMGGYQGQCLNEDTLILTDNEQIEIKYLNIGDSVLSYNDITKKLELKPIINIWYSSISNANNRYFYIYYNNGKIIKATENHRFYINGEYKRADELQIGDLLLSSDLEEYSIENIEIVENTTDMVWDIEVEDNHNFFANDILVHNLSYYAYVDHIRMTVYYTN